MNHRNIKRALGLQMAFLLFPVLTNAAEIGLDSIPPGFAIPSNPATNYLGSNPTEISSPVTARQFESEIVNAIDSSGRIKQGFAMQFALWPLILPNGITLAEYQRPRGYAMANTQLSLATEKSSGDSSSTDAALGLNVTWWNQGDLFASKDFTDEIKAEDAKCPPPVGPEDTERNWSCRDSVERLLKNDWKKKIRWNAGGLATSAAVGWNLKRSRADSLDWTGILLLATGSLRLGDWGKLLGQIGYEFRNNMIDSLTSNGIRFGSKLVFGGRSINGYGEYDGVINIVKHEGLFDRTDGKISAGVEYMVLNNFWISTGLGYGVLGASEKDVITIANLKWGTATGPKIAK